MTTPDEMKSIYTDLTSKGGTDAVNAITRTLDLLPNITPVRGFALLSVGVEVAYATISSGLASLITPPDHPLPNLVSPEIMEAAAYLLLASEHSGSTWNHRFVNAQRLCLLCTKRTNPILDAVIPRGEEIERNARQRASKITP